MRTSVCGAGSKEEVETEMQVWAWGQQELSNAQGGTRTRALATREFKQRRSAWGSAWAHPRAILARST